MVSQLCHDVFFHHRRTVKVLRVRGVVRATIRNDPLHVGNEQSLVAVVLGLEPLRHRLQVHRVLDVVVVVGDRLPVDGKKERPRGLVVLRSVEDGLERAVQHVGVVRGPGVGPATGPLGGRDPAGLEDPCKISKIQTYYAGFLLL